jgi:ABC-type glycerol-3-phosphate transport system substrate-binding protein
MLKRIRAAAALILMLIFVIPLASCSGPQGTPAPTAFAPLLAVDSGELTIARFSSIDSVSDDQSHYNLPYLQKLLKDRGWNIKYKIEGAGTDDQTGELQVEQAVQIDIAAGEAADGYIVNVSEAKKLLDAGLTQNLGKILPAAAPALFERHKPLFGDSIAGLPVVVFHNLYPAGRQSVLYLQSDVAAKAKLQVYTINDVLSLLEKDDKTKIGANPEFGSYISFTAEQCILTVWAGEQGYYPLSTYKIGGGLYAALDDPKCTPVAIESIAGFEEIFGRSLNLYNGKRIIDVWDNERMASKGTIGYIDTLSNGMYPGFLNNHQKNGMDYTACPLAGCAWPALPADEPSIRLELAVSAASPKAQQLSRFVQWALMDQENYELVRYGVQGVDYRLEGMRVEYLNNGKALVPEDWEVESKAYFNSNFNLFHEDTMDCTTVYAPVNYEDLVATKLTVIPPMWSTQKPIASFSDNYTTFIDIFNQFEKTISTRTFLLGGELTTDNGQVKGSIAECLAGFSAVHDDTGKMIDAYQARIQQLLDKQAK